ncbi:hypothetical protein ACHWQZ_G015365 [Mnemiopsis leidyi]
MTISNNYTDIKFAIQSDTERYIWAVYFLIGVLSSVIGDTLILIASSRGGVFKVSKFLVAIIQHIAVSDLASVITFLLPTNVSLIANVWILGKTLCYARAYTAYVIYMTGMSLIAVLTTSKFLILQYPLRAARWTTKTAHQVCSLVWISSLITPILFLAVDKDDLQYDYRVYNCRYKFTDPVWKKIVPVIGFLFGFVPNIVIISTTVPTLNDIAEAWIKYTRRPWIGALTVSLTVVIYCISTLSFSVYVVGRSFVKEEPPGKYRIQFFRISTFLILVNVTSNFYIFILTFESFGRFVSSGVSKFISVLSFSGIGRLLFTGLRHRAENKKKEDSGNTFEMGDIGS